jgi:hypothetical protein
MITGRDARTAEKLEFVGESAIQRNRSVWKSLTALWLDSLSRAARGKT